MSTPAGVEGVSTPAVVEGVSTPAERTEAPTPAVEEDTSAAKASMSRTTGDLLFLFFFVEVGVAAGGGNA